MSSPEEQSAPDAAHRYAELWEKVKGTSGCVVAAEVVEPHVPGSLRYERTRLVVPVGEAVEISVTNGQATFFGDNPDVLARLAALEAVVAATVPPAEAAQVS